MECFYITERTYTFGIATGSLGIDHGNMDGYLLEWSYFYSGLNCPTLAMGGSLCRFMPGGLEK